MNTSPSQPAPAEVRGAVLIVDDVEANLRVIEALLEEVPCEVVRATSGNDALRQMLKREFAVVLLDVHMPIMDGFEVAQLMRANPATRALPIVFVTASDHTEAKVPRGYGSGAVDVLFKPLDPFILRSKVQVFLDLHASRRALARAYVDLEQMQAQLVQSAKMSSLGELVLGIAHEIDHPLAFATSNLGSALRCLKRIEPDVQQALTPEGAESWQCASDQLSEMSVGLERMRDLVLKLRTFSRLDEGERKVVGVRECIDSVLTIFGHRTRGRIQVDVSVDEPDLLDCYPALFNQALSNLVSNAIDAIDGEGRIRISGRHVGKTYVLTVADTGPGIPVALRARVCEPFFTTKPVGSGTGLGLSITDSIVQMHGGSLEIDDAEGGGASLSIHIPLDPSSGASA